MRSRFLASAALATSALFVVAAGPADAATAAAAAGTAAAAPAASGAAHAGTAASRPGKGLSTASVIVCTPQVQNPHNSSHVRGTVNVVVTVKCTGAVPTISVRAALYRNGHLVKQSAVRTVHNARSAQNNAAVPCTSGTYQGWMSYGVVFPPRYVPPTGSSSGFGQAVKITC